MWKRKTNLHMSLLRALCELVANIFQMVLAEDIHAEVAVGVAPDAVSVVAGSLCIVVFNEKSRPLNAVVVWHSPVDAACPGEGKRSECFVRELGHFGRRKFVG